MSPQRQQSSLDSDDDKQGIVRVHVGGVETHLGAHLLVADAEARLRGLCLGLSPVFDPLRWDLVRRVHFSAKHPEQRFAKPLGSIGGAMSAEAQASLGYKQEAVAIGLDISKFPGLG